MARELNPLFLKITMVDMDDILRNPHLMQTCRNLSHGQGDPDCVSGMNYFLKRRSQEVKDRSIDAMGIFAHYLNTPVGWVLLSYEDDAFCFHPPEGNKESAVAQIYVRQDWRRQGIGSRLMQFAIKVAEPDTVRVYRHSAEEFFVPLIERNQNLICVYD